VNMKVNGNAVWWKDEDEARSGRWKGAGGS